MSAKHEKPIATKINHIAATSTDWTAGIPACVSAKHEKRIVTKNDHISTASTDWTTAGIPACVSAKHEKPIVTKIDHIATSSIDWTAGFPVRPRAEPGSVYNLIASIRRGSRDVQAGMRAVQSLDAPPSFDVFACN